MMADWKYLFADLRTNQIIDEIPMSGVRISKVLNGAGAMQGTIQLGDGTLVGRAVKESTRPARRAVYAIRDNAPFWGGIIWASDYDSDTRQLTIGATDWWSYFDHRRILETITLPVGGYDVAGQSRIYAAQDQNAIARDLVTLAQSHTAGDIGVVVDTAVSGVVRDRTYDGFALKATGEALRDLANLADGPDIVFDVGTFVNGRPQRIMRTGSPMLTQQGDDHVWDLGANLLKFVWSSGGGVMSTRAFVSGAGQDRGTLIAVSEDAAAYANGWPLLEADDAHQDVSQLATLQQYADSAVLSVPPVTVILTVRGDMAPTVGAYNVGDTAHVIVPKLVTTVGVDGKLNIERGDPFLPDGLDLVVRLTGFNVAIDDAGVESVELSSFPSSEVS